MRTGAAAGHTGHFHEALCYRSDDEFLAVVVPFLLDGVAAGEPTLVSLADDDAARLRQALPAGAEVVFLPGDVYGRPAAAIRAYRDVLAAHSAAGAQQIRLLGELPSAVFGPVWDWWARYEAGANRIYDDFPLWSMCAYDARAATPRVLDDVARTHPRIATPEGRHVVNDRFMDPETFLRRTVPVGDDPLQHTPPAIDLIDPLPAAARAAVEHLDRGRLTERSIEDLTTAVSEAVTNAIVHGRPHVRARYWVADGRIVVAVTDRGTGPTDPYAGLVPTAGRDIGGFGLWLIHQLCDHVALQRHDDGFTVRMTVGRIPDHQLTAGIRG
jgi:anti-sigma regulatory factor (Ser/Thr protein kinase)